MPQMWGHFRAGASEKGQQILLRQPQLPPCNCVIQLFGDVDHLVEHVFTNMIENGRKRGC
jgi:hypothetical protein